MTRGCLMLLLGTVLSGQITRPLTSIASKEKAAALGAALAAEERRTATVVDGPETPSFVKMIGMRLVAAIPTRQFDYQFTVILSGTRDAIALPGGYIFVSTTCILNSRNEAEFAETLARAIGHVELWHGVQPRDQIANSENIPLVFIGGWTDENVSLPKQFEEARRIQNLEAEDFALRLMSREKFSNTTTPDLERAKQQLTELLRTRIFSTPTLRRPNEQVR